MTSRDFNGTVCEEYVATPWLADAMDPATFVVAGFRPRPATTWGVPPPSTPGGPRSWAPTRTRPRPRVFAAWLPDR